MTQEQYDAECEYWRDLEHQRATEQQIAIIDIALVKSYSYTQTYDPTTGRLSDKDGHTYLKEGYIDGFLAGFTHKLTGD
jgi:hypothetical protein